MEGGWWSCWPTRDLWRKKRLFFRQVDQGWCYLKGEQQFEFIATIQPTLVIYLYGDEVAAAWVVGDADAALVQLEAGYLADVDVVGPVGQEAMQGHP